MRVRVYVYRPSSSSSSPEEEEEEVFALPPLLGFRRENIFIA